MSERLTPAQVAASDQEIAQLRDVLRGAVEKWPAYLPDEPYAFRISALMHSLEIQVAKNSLLALLAIAIDQLWSHKTTPSRTP